jgi:hypothetical protein
MARTSALIAVGIVLMAANCGNSPTCDEPYYMEWFVFVFDAFVVDDGY